jgi:flagella basal body P-ring formation protein FlgA
MRTLAVAITLTLISSVTMAGYSVKLHHRTSVEHSEIRLIDLIESSNLNEDVNSQLANITLGEAPRFGEQRVLSNLMLSRLLRKVLKRNGKIIIPNKVIVVGHYPRLTKENVKKALVRNLQSQCEGCLFKIRSLKLPEETVVPLGARWLLKENSSLPRGSFTVRLDVMDSADRVVHRGWVSGELRIYKDVAVIQRSVVAGEPVREGDVRFERRDITFNRFATPSQEFLGGCQYKRGMNAFDIVWKKDLSRRQVVKFGQTIDVLVGGDEWQVEMKAQAKQSGCVGDLIKVQNIQTKKTFSGIVTRNGQVRVQ